MRHFKCIKLIALAAFAVAGTAFAQENMIQNAGFEDGVLEPWSVYGDAAAPNIDKDAHTGAHALKIEVQAPGANFWDAGLQYKPDHVIFEDGIDYTWAFFAKSDPPVEINIKPELAVDPWTAYGDKRANLTEEYQEFWTEWNVQAVVQPAALTLHIQFGKATLWFDDARWYEGAYEPFDGEPQSVNPNGKAAATWASLKSQ